MVKNRVEEAGEDCADTDFDDEEEYQPEKDDDEEQYVLPEEAMSETTKRSSTASATRLVTEEGLSTRKAANICSKLADEGMELPTPSQSGIWRRLQKEAEKRKKEIMSYLAKEDFCLHFDGKRLQGKEYQVVLLHSSTHTIRLGVLACATSGADDIFDGIKGLLDTYDTWGSIKMIITHTTAVNTGAKEWCSCSAAERSTKEKVDDTAVRGLPASHPRLGAKTRHGLLLANLYSITKP